MTTESSGLMEQGSLAELQMVSKLRGLVHELWFELGPDFHILSSNSKSIWNREKWEKKGPASPGPDRPTDLDFIRDNYLICFISMLPQGLAGRPVGSLQFEKACSQPEACGSGH